jgi:hypothetical protein
MLLTIYVIGFIVTAILMLIGLKAPDIQKTIEKVITTKAKRMRLFIYIILAIVFWPITLPFSLLAAIWNLIK